MITRLPLVITDCNSLQHRYKIMGMTERTFGNWLRGQRLQRGLSQGKLAKAVDMDRSHISRIESGSIVLPGIETREQFHKFFGTDEQDLIDLGIVKQYDQWGMEIVRPPTATAFGQGLPPNVISTNEQSSDQDDDSPLTPEEREALSTAIFSGLNNMTPRKLRELIRVIQETE